jgi:hypothetical protein
MLVSATRCVSEPVIFEEQALSEDNKNKADVGVYIALGVGVGVALGAAFGAAFGNVAMGAAFGPALGAGFGVALWAAKGGNA